MDTDETHAYCDGRGHLAILIFKKKKISSRLMQFSVQSKVYLR